jgi:hypothetical protein
VSCGFVHFNVQRDEYPQVRRVYMCPRGDSQLTYTVPVALTIQFTLTSSGA